VKSPCKRQVPNAGERVFDALRARQSSCSSMKLYSTATESDDKSGEAKLTVPHRAELIGRWP
jgi:hypothetical protein